MKLFILFLRDKKVHIVLVCIVMVFRADRVCEYNNFTSFNSHIITSWKCRCLGCRDTPEGLLSASLCLHCCYTLYAVICFAERISYRYVCE